LIASSKARLACTNRAAALIGETAITVADLAPRRLDSIGHGAKAHAFGFRRTVAMRAGSGGSALTMRVAAGPAARSAKTVAAGRITPVPGGAAGTAA